MKKRLICVLVICTLLLCGCTPDPNSPESDPAPFDFDVLNKEEPVEILVLGNSFIWTSNVCGFLRRICEENQAEVNVREHSVGMIQAKEHYLELFEYGSMPEVLEDRYDVIVLQTLYDAIDLRTVDDFMAAFEEHDLHAQLLLFPAENEPSHAEAAKTRNRQARLANWRMLLLNLKQNEGFTRESLNISDAYLHSNELAGYAGAVLLYQRMYQEVPEVAELDNYMLSAHARLIPGESEREKRDSLRTIVRCAGEQLSEDDLKFYQLYCWLDERDESL